MVGRNPNAIRLGTSAWDACSTHNNKRTVWNVQSLVDMHRVKPTPVACVLVLVVFLFLFLFFLCCCCRWFRRSFGGWRPSCRFGRWRHCARCWSRRLSGFARWRPGAGRGWASGLGRWRPGAGRWRTSGLGRWRSSAWRWWASGCGFGCSRLWTGEILRAERRRPGLLTCVVEFAKLKAHIPPCGAGSKLKTDDASFTSHNERTVSQLNRFTPYHVISLYYSIKAEPAGHRRNIVIRLSSLPVSLYQVQQ